MYYTHTYIIYRDIMNTEESSCSLESLTNSKEISQTTFEFSTKEKLKDCFKLRYHVRRVKNEGAILVIVWSFLMTVMHYYITYTSLNTYSSHIFILLQSIVGLTLPLGGWLADVRLGRYKVISLSLWTMWFSSILMTFGLVILQLLNLEHELYYHRLLLILLFPLGIGFGLFQANIVQFGLDQLYDASSNEIMAFVVWYSWTSVCSVFIMGARALYAINEYKLFTSLLVSINLTLAVSSNILLKSILIVEPKIQNPFKLVYTAVRYAVKNKHPRQKSAFTFCENNIPSRIDFGKRKYGGPFTTEQVEDVKTLFRVVLVILVGCAFYGITMIPKYMGPNVRSIFTKTVSHSPKYVFSNFYAIAGLLLIPLNELLLHPLFHRCLPNLKSLGKFLVGATLRFGWYVTILILITYARHNYINMDVHTENLTLACLYESPNFLSNSLDYRWTVLLDILLAVSDIFIIIGAIQFFCAQVPYSMKGLVAGILYGLLALFMVFSQVISSLFKMKSVAWGTGTLSCGFWYLLTIVVFMVAMIIAFVLVAKWYKKRKREDVLPNEHIFAERYYSKSN